MHETEPCRPRRFLRFSLRGLLVLVAVCSVWLGIAFHRAREQSQAVAAIQASGGFVYYDYHIVDDAPEPSLTSTVPGWLLENLGIDFFHDVVDVTFDEKTSEDDLAVLECLPKTRMVWLCG